MPLTGHSIRPAPFLSGRAIPGTKQAADISPSLWPMGRAIPLYSARPLPFRLFYCCWIATVSGIAVSAYLARRAIRPAPYLITSPISYYIAGPFGPPYTFQRGSCAGPGPYTFQRDIGCPPYTFQHGCDIGCPYTFSMGRMLLAATP